MLEVCMYIHVHMYHVVKKEGNVITLEYIIYVHYMNFSHLIIFIIFHSAAPPDTPIFHPPSYI